MWNSNITCLGERLGGRVLFVRGLVRSRWLSLFCCASFVCWVLLVACSSAEGEPPFSRGEGEEFRDGPTGRVVHGGRVTSAAGSGADGEGSERPTQSGRPETGSLQGLPSAEARLDESVPPPAGLVDQSDPFAPGRRYRLNESYRTRIDELKRQLDGMADGPAKDQLLAKLDELVSQYRSTREGLIDTQTVIGGEGPSEMTEDERSRLLRLMANYDMSKPEDLAAWNRVKSEELGR